MLDMLRTKQYQGDDTEDPYAHIDFFEDICGTFRLNAFTDDEMKLKLFNHTLSDKSLSWFKSHPTGTFNSWDKLSVAFLTRLYPERKSYGARRMITNLKNRPGESLIKGCIRFHGLLDHCPHHELPPWLV